MSTMGVGGLNIMQIRGRKKKQSELFRFRVSDGVLANVNMRKTCGHKLKEKYEYVSDGCLF